MALASGVLGEGHVKPTVVFAYGQMMPTVSLQLSQMRSAGR